MSYETKPAFIHFDDWNATSDRHPAMKFMHDYTNAFDEGVKSVSSHFSKWCDPSFTYSKSTGQIFPAGEESVEAVVKDYSFFTKYHHEPYFFVCYESASSPGDYEMTGNAWLYCNLPGESEGSESLTDKAGQKWQLRVPGGFHFVYKKDGDSFKLGTTSITSDTGPVVVELLKRGVMKPSDLGL